MASPNDAEAEAEAGPKPKKGGGLMAMLLPVLLLTLLAAGGGGLIGMQILAGIKHAGEGKSPALAAPDAGRDSLVKELVPIVTNLADPDAGLLIRLQTAIVYDKADTPQIDLLSAKIGDDILAFTRTLTLGQLQGAAGLQHLREDLNERVAIRSDGRIRELIIETLVIQ